MIYIGQTKDLKLRDQKHCNGKVMRIDRAIRKYGRQNFLMSIILASKNEEQIVYAEIDWIRRARAALGSNMVYNVANGGSNGWNGLKHSKESRRKMSKAHKGIHVGDKNNMFGKNHNPKSISLMSKNRKGKSVGEERPNTILNQEMVNAIKNDNRSERTLAKLYGVSRSAINSIKRGINWK